MQNTLYDLLWKYANTYHTVVPFSKEKDKLLLMNFTAENVNLTEEILANTALFSEYVNYEIDKAKATYGVGGYDEHRTVYSRSKVFDTKDEPRRLHLGIDIWGPAGTPVFAPLDGIVHSFGFNNNFGDYGATIILQHQIDGISFNSLYGHLSKKDITDIQEGEHIKQGVEFAHFGEPAENGFWPPHLHFQIVENMYEWVGDYPGVCKFSEREKYLANSPDPDIILQMIPHPPTPSP